MIEEKKPDIAVIMCLYNSSYEKALSTLLSLVKQRDSSFEIIIADDGSEVDITTELLHDAIESGFDQALIKIARLLDNHGTVSNVANAISLVNAPIVTFTSPGDMFYDEYVLSNYVKAINDQDIEIVFGKGIRYSFDNGLTTYRVCNPLRARRFDTRGCGTHGAIKAVVQDYDYLLGAAIAYDTRLFRYAIRVIEGHSKYVEDGTSVVTMLLAGGNAAPIDRYVVWHEFGTGVSTNGNWEWQEIIKSDYTNTWQALLELYPRQKLLSNEVKRRLIYNKISLPPVCKKAFWRLLHINTVPAWLDRKVSQRSFKYSEYSTDYLDSIVREAGIRILSKKEAPYEGD